MNRPTLALIGEGGEREFVIPESKLRSAASRWGGGAVVAPGAITVNAAPGQDPRAIARFTIAELQRSMARSRRTRRSMGGDHRSILG